MFEKLNELLDLYDFDSAETHEFWYSEGIDEATDMIDGFRQEDWDALYASLPGKSALWKERLANILGGVSVPNELRILQVLADTEDDILFKTVICDLSRYDPEQLEKLENRELIVEKAEKLRPSVGEVYESYFEVFLRKRAPGSTRIE